MFRDGNRLESIMIKLDDIKMLSEILEKGDDTNNPFKAFKGSSRLVKIVSLMNLVSKSQTLSNLLKILSVRTM